MPKKPLFWSAGFLVRCLSGMKDISTGNFCGVIEPVGGGRRHQIITVSSLSQVTG